VVADEVLATAAAAELGLIRSDAWPMVAAHLLTCGHDGADLLALACLGNGSSGWQVDQLVPGTLRDIGAPDLSVEAAGEIIARLLAQDAAAISDYSLVRTLARLAPDLDYPSGVIGRAYSLDEWLRHGPSAVLERHFCCSRDVQNESIPNRQFGVGARRRARALAQGTS
jgi:hypothetical protein